MSGYAAANHSVVTETLTGSPPSPISLILNRILLETGAIDRRKRRNYRGHVRRVKLGGIRLRSGFLLANRVERGRALPPKLIAGGFGRGNGWGPPPFSSHLDRLLARGAQRGAAAEQQKRPEIFVVEGQLQAGEDRKSTRLNSSHSSISYAVFCLKKKKVYEHATPQ